MTHGATSARFELVDHTAETTLRLRAPTFAGLVVQATEGFLSLVPDALRSDRPGQPTETPEPTETNQPTETPEPTETNQPTETNDRQARVFDFDAGDRTATLVEWINEMVFRGEAESWLPVDPVVDDVGPTGIHVRCGALPLVEPFVLVKAATLHGAEIREVDGALEVDVTLDI